MMYTLLTLVFIAGYIAIAFEHPLRINKTASALLTGVLCWTIYLLGTGDVKEVTGNLSHHLSSISEILFFLLGAMTIVEVIDAHQGFKIITNRIETNSKRRLLWIVSFITFFLSAALDNLTTTIVMVSLLGKMLDDANDRKIFAGMVIIAANAGGAWSPIGDVTTTMLWIGGQISALNTINTIFIPSLFAMIVPLLMIQKWVTGPINRKVENDLSAIRNERLHGSVFMFVLGIGGLLFVPIFKTATHMPPYMAMLLVLAIIWIASDLLHVRKDDDEKHQYSAAHALTKIDTPSVLFFLGILLSVATLESTHILENFAHMLEKSIGNLDVIVAIIGVGSAIVDNVPLVAASMAMYPIEQYAMDAKLWSFMAYCAGTGGSILIIGSAAGVAAMGIEKIDFIWYFKKISLPAFIGYGVGCVVFLLQYLLIN